MKCEETFSKNETQQNRVRHFEEVVNVIVACAWSRGDKGTTFIATVLIWLHIKQFNYPIFHCSTKLILSTYLIIPYIAHRW